MAHKRKILIFLLFVFSNFIKTLDLEAKIENKIIAIVGTKAITKYDLDSKINMIAFLNNKNPESLNDKNFRKDVLNNLIEESLINEQISKLGISMSEDEFSKELGGLLQQTNISQNKLLQAINNGLFSKTTLSNFVKYQVLMGKLVREKLINELEYSNNDKVQFLQNTKEKVKKSSSDYKIIIINKTKLNVENEKINSCESLSNFLSKGKLPIVSQNIIKSKDINKELLQAILIGNKKSGFINYNNLTIGFCMLESSNFNSISNEQLENIFKNELIIKAIKKNIDELKTNNYILIKN